MGQLIETAALMGQRQPACFPFTLCCMFTCVVLGGGVQLPRVCREGSRLHTRCGSEASRERTSAVVVGPATTQICCPLRKSTQSQRGTVPCRRTMQLSSINKHDSTQHDCSSISRTVLC